MSSTSNSDHADSSLSSRLLLLRLLPIEVLSMIFTYLSPTELFRCQRVCKALRDAVNGYLPVATLFRGVQLLTTTLRLQPAMAQRVYKGVWTLAELNSENFKPVLFSTEFHPDLERDASCPQHVQ